MSIKTKRVLSGILAIVLTVAIIAGFTIPALADDMDELQQQQEELEQQQADAEAVANATAEELAAAQEQVDAVQQEVVALNQQIDEIGQKVAALVASINENQTKLDETQQQLEAQQQELATYYDQFKDRVQMMYENDRTSYLEVLLDASSISDFFSRLEYISEVVSYDNKVMGDMKDCEQRIAESKATIEETQTQLEADKAAEEQEQASLQEVLDQKQAEFDSLESNRVALELMRQQQAETQASIAAMLQQNADAQVAEQARLDQEAAAAQAAAAAAAAQQQQAQQQQQGSTETGSIETGSTETGSTDTGSGDSGSSSSGGGSYTPGESYAGTADSSDSRARSDGWWNTWPGIGSAVLGWPLDGSSGWHFVLSSLYGMRVHPITGEYRSHNGIDMLGNYGDLILAAQGGTVVTACNDGWGGGYGNYVVIDHGNGLSTLYAHCSSLAVSTGDVVGQGQVIAYVGSTGMSTGPHLHFEVYSYGCLVDPENYL